MSDVSEQLDTSVQQVQGLKTVTFTVNTMELMSRLRGREGK